VSLWETGKSMERLGIRESIEAAKIRGYFGELGDSESIRPSRRAG